MLKKFGSVKKDDIIVETRIYRYAQNERCFRDIGKIG